MSEALETAYQSAMRFAGINDTKETRRAFYAGALHFLDTLIPHLDGRDESMKAAEGMNDALYVFATGKEKSKP